MKHTLLLVSLAAAVFCAGCPDPKEVGSVPYQQVKDTRTRVDKVEQKLEKNAEAANAAQE